MTALPRTSVPAESALALIGVTTLEAAAEHSEKELLALHGVGPKAIRIIREALAERGWDFATQPATGRNP